MKHGNIHKLVTIVSVSTVALAVFAALVAVRGLRSSVGELREELAKTQADAILAKVDLSSDTAVAVPILYYSQVADGCTNMYDTWGQATVFARQFEWESCGYYRSEVETGLVEMGLGADYLPVAVGGTGTPNRGVSGDNFKRWFSVVEGQSKNYAGTLGLKYNAETTSFSYRNAEFYPLSEITGEDGLFTLNLGVPFRALLGGDEEFVITADDDTWVFVGKELVIDMGGVHDAATGRFKIDEEGKIYSGVDGNFEYTGVKLKADEDAIVRVFHANRNSKSSVFEMEFKNMVLNITSTRLAQGDTGVEVAYDPDNPSYVAPLGESMVIGPNMKRSFAVAIVVQGLAVGAFSILAMVAISVAWRYSRRDRNRVK